MENNFKGTKGESKVEMPESSNGWAWVDIDCNSPHNTITVSTGYFTDKKGEELRLEKERVLADAQLVADARDVRQQIDCSLPELLEITKELLSKAKDAANLNGTWRRDDLLCKADKALNESN